MIALLPAFALLLMLAYAGSRRRYPMRPRRFAEHLVYAAHHHALAFLVILLIAVAPWTALRALLVVWALIYTLLSMKRVYGGRWAGVVARASFVAIAYAVLFAISVVALLLAAVILA